MNEQNRPIPGSDANLKRFWPVYPQYIQDAFIRAFSHDVMMKKKPRLLETEWLDLFFRLRAETGPCPLCKRETFYIYIGMYQIFCGVPGDEWAVHVTVKDADSGEVISEHDFPTRGE